MTYVKDFLHRDPGASHERVCLRTLEAAALAVEHVLRDRHRCIDFWAGYPPLAVTQDQIGAHLLLNRLVELRDLIEFYEGALERRAPPTT